MGWNKRLQKSMRRWSVITLAVCLSGALAPANLPAQGTAWDNSRLWGLPDPSPEFSVEPIYSGWTWTEPVGMARPQTSERLFVVERRGRIYSFVDSPRVRDGESFTPELFLDVRDIDSGTREIYGLAFPPDYPTDSTVYVCYIAAPDHDEGTRVSRFNVLHETGVPRVDLDTEEVLLTFRSGGHNGGCLRFGPDRMLYISTGDAGPASPPDPIKTGQDNRDFLSCILRIDVLTDSDAPYLVPPDNPFLQTPDTRPEIWAYGLRNPWKMAFDPTTGDLWVGDVGWELWEMVYRIERGGNYGWSVREGYQLIHPDDRIGPTPVLPPTMVHSHRESRSITGGYVYQGKRFPDLLGAYVYGDYETGKVWSFSYQDQRVVKPRELADTNLKLVAFGENHADELLLVDMLGGLYQLAPNETDRFNPEFPTRLSQTGLFSDVANLQAAKGVVEYWIQAEPWMDGAAARRWVAIPADATARQQGDGFVFPEGSVLVKTIFAGTSGLAAPEHRIETQVQLWLDGHWHGFSYGWNAEQTDAELIGADGGVIEFAETTNGSSQLEQGGRWTVPSRTECTVCHTTFQPQMGALGFDPLQLDVDDWVGKQSQIGASQPVPDSQTESLIHAGVLPAGYQSQTTLADPYNPSADLSDRARSYLHVNCRHCHRDGGGGGSTMKLAFTLSPEQLDLFDWTAQHGDFGLQQPKRIAPGTPEHSVLLARVVTTGRGRMPYKGSERVDRAGVSLLAEWIRSLADGSPTVEIELNQTPTELRSALHQMTRSQALATALRLHQPQVDQELRETWASAALESPDPVVRDLLMGVTGRPSPRKTLGRELDTQSILEAAGDPILGQEYFASQQLQCAKCHAVGGVGGEVGPDLSKVASRLTAAQLLESLSQPSAKFSEGFETWVVETTDGRVLTGRLKARDDQTLTLLDASAQSHTVALEDVDRQERVDRSLMPDDLVPNMTREELTDLLAYLKSLR